MKLNGMTLVTMFALAGLLSAPAFANSTPVNETPQETTETVEAGAQDEAPTETEAGNQETETLPEAGQPETEEENVVAQPDTEPEIDLGGAEQPRERVTDREERQPEVRPRPRRDSQDRLDREFDRMDREAGHAGKEDQPSFKDDDFGDNQQSAERRRRGDNQQSVDDDYYGKGDNQQSGGDYYGKGDNQQSGGFHSDKFDDEYDAAEHRPGKGSEFQKSLRRDIKAANNDRGLCRIKVLKTRRGVRFHIKSYKSSCTPFSKTTRKPYGFFGSAMAMHHDCERQMLGCQIAEGVESVFDHVVDAGESVIDWMDRNRTEQPEWAEDAFKGGDH